MNQWGTILLMDWYARKLEKLIFRPNFCYHSLYEKIWLREEDRLGDFTRPKRLQNLVGTEIAMDAA
jgi:hypothetical protein